MTTRTAVWPSLVYDDAPAAIEFLDHAFGLATVLVVPNEHDPRIVEHAELRWPCGGGIMLGSADRAGNPFSQRPSGTAAVYLVTDQPDELLDRAIAAGAELVAPIEDHDYGNRGFTVTDPEGNIWSFGTYAGAV